MPNLPDCAAYPRSLCGPYVERIIVHRHDRRVPAAIRRVEALAARWDEPANVADGRGFAGDFCQCCDLGSAG
jgi:hypothetical protein